MADELKTIELEVWVLLDQCGDYGVGKDMETACTNYKEEVGSLDDLHHRYIKVTLTVPLPGPVELKGTVPPEVATGQLKVV